MTSQFSFNPRARSFQTSRKVPSASGIPPQGSIYAHHSRFENLPVTLLISIFAELSTTTLLNVAATSRYLRETIHKFSIPDRLRELLPRPMGHRAIGLQHDHYKTVKFEFAQLSGTLQLQRLECVSRNIEQGYFSVASEATWSHKAMPIIKIDEYKMMLASGNELWASFHGANWVVTTVGKTGVGDISDMTLTGSVDEVIVSYVDGRVERVKLAQSAGAVRHHTPIMRYRMQTKRPIESIDYDRKSQALLAVTQGGQIMVNNSIRELDARPWCTTFVNECKTATGTRSRRALMIHEVIPTGLQHSRAYTTGSDAVTSVFDISVLSPDLVLSGWYDGTIRLHDLRTPHDQSVQAWREPWDDAAVYSIANSGNSLYAGSAINGVLRMFDLRTSHCIRSLFLGHKTERGPVYSLAAEHERVFGAMEKCVRGVDYHRTNTRHSLKNDWLGDNQSGRKIFPKRTFELLPALTGQIMLIIQQGGSSIVYRIKTLAHSAEIDLIAAV